MVGPEGAERSSAVRAGDLGEPEDLPVAIEDREIELREDPHQAPRERGGPRLRPLAPERGLEGLPADRPRTAQRAVEGCQRVAQGEVPLMYALSKA